MQQHSQIVYPNTFFVHNILKIGGKTILFLNFLNSRTILKQFQDKTKKVVFFKNNLSTKKIPEQFTEFKEFQNRWLPC